MSPTLSIHATQAGLILGTAAYMSPEQAAGKPADKRSDIWAFGVVLLEMLTGGQAFTGETVPHVLASVLKSEPDWSRLPPIRRRRFDDCYVDVSRRTASDDSIQRWRPVWRSTTRCPRLTPSPRIGRWQRAGASRRSPSPRYLAERSWLRSPGRCFVRRRRFLVSRRAFCLRPPSRC